MVTNETLKNKREQAVRLVQEITSIKDSISNVKVESDSLLKHIEKNDKNYKKLITVLDKINSSTEVAIIDFRSERDRIKSLLTQVNNFYEKRYIPLLNKIENSETGFRAKITSSNNELKELEKIKLKCVKQYEDIKKSVEEYKSKNKELSALNTRIRRLCESSEKNKDKSDLLLSKILINDKEIKNILDSNKDRNIEISTLEKSIKKREKDTENLFNKINRLYIESNDKRKQIQDVYEIAHATGLSGEFEKRRNHLNESLRKWEQRILWSSVILLLGIIILFICQLKLYNWEIETHNFDFNFYIRFLILSPVVYYLVFCSREYNKITKLHDKYSFKTTLAMTIKSHIELLTNVEAFKTEERQDKVMNFIMDGFEKIYSEPYENDNFKMKVQLSNLKLELEKSILKKINAKEEK